jgi:hypothetical protein
LQKFLFLGHPGIGIDADADGIDISTSGTLLRYQIIPVPDWFPLFRGLVPALAFLIIMVPD